MSPRPDKPARNQAYRQAAFLISAASQKQFPPGDGLEVAFAGRSNAGKSSAINTLCDNKTLARISKTPGRTRQINFFALDELRRLVDLPGYGYARVPQPMKEEWEALMESYLQQGGPLRGVVVIMDVRHPMKDYDMRMLDWCHHYGLACHVLLTKADKLKRGAAQSALLKTRRQLGEAGYDCSVQLFSALKKTGLDTLVNTMDRWLEFTPEQTADRN